MALMKYDAMNLGIGDLAFGMDFFQKRSSRIPFPLVSTNLESEKKFSFLEQVIIQDVGGSRVAILGIVSDDVPALKNIQGLKVLSPVVAIRNQVAEVSKKTDFIIYNRSFFSK